MPPIADRRYLARVAMLLLPACFSPSETEDTESATDATGTGGSADTAAAPSTTGMDADATATGPDSSGDDAKTGSSVCGDGQIEGDEVCDDGVNDGSYGGCAPDCGALGPYCGDGRVSGDEQCDDGNATAADGCNPDCVPSATQVWCRTFDGALGAADGATDVAVGPDDQIVAVGYEGVAGMARDAWVRQYDPDGTTQWTETWNAQGNATARAVEVGPAGQVVATGTDDGDIFVLGVSPGGDVSWERIVAGDSFILGFSGGYGVAMDAGGHAYVVGQIDNEPSREIWLRRYDVDGNEVWTQIVDGGDTTDLGRAIGLSGDQLTVAGRLDDTTTWLRRYDTDGVADWTETDAVGHAPVDLAVDSTGAAIVAAGPELWLRKLDPAGSTVWTETDTAFTNTGVCGDSSDDVVVHGDDATSARVRKYDPEGNEVWSAQLDLGPDAGVIVSGRCAIDSTDAIIVAGAVTSAANQDAYVCKLTP